MFTGIVRAVGRIEALEARDGDVELVVGCAGLDLSAAAIGDSISVGGACLTVIRLRPAAFAADVSRETLARTSLGRLAVGSRVNLEPALRAGDPLGGHYVTGHVDGVGYVAGVEVEGRSWRVVIQAPRELARYIAPKGSVTLDGVSLTVNEVDGRRFGVNLIPHTREVTTLGELASGSAVNIEVDIIARYVERLVAGRS
jgi:riboflavin synthase